MKVLPAALGDDFSLLVLDLIVNDYEDIPTILSDLTEPRKGKRLDVTENDVGIALLSLMGRNLAKAYRYNEHNRQLDQTENPFSTVTHPAQAAYFIATNEGKHLINLLPDDWLVEWMRNF